jgi:hypothetical protein
MTGFFIRTTDPAHNNEFIKDMLGPINRNVDRSVMPTRKIIDDKLYLLAIKPVKN